MSRLRRFWFRLLRRFRVPPEPIIIRSPRPEDIGKPLFHRDALALILATAEPSFADRWDEEILNAGKIKTVIPPLYPRTRGPEFWQ